MNKTAHRIYLSLLSLIVLLAFAAIANKGYTYYELGIEDRFFHNDHTLLKPSGIWGHGMGIIGSLFMILGVLLYMFRKRYRIFSRIGILKHWLEFHIFLCTLGPILVLFHTSFKFGGIVAISFWSMVAVFLSGIIGRFIYIQIPRTIEGRELSLNEVRDLAGNISNTLTSSLGLDEESTKIIVNAAKPKAQLQSGNFVSRYFNKQAENRKTLASVKAVLEKNNLPKTQRTEVINLVKNEWSLNRRIERLVLMQNLFKYWHVAHLPFALVMLVIMIIHVAVTIVFGYRWIF
jgi:phenylpyruvate tautomerase PptA (4-oxalocrotonate tautomerase family)